MAKDKVTYKEKYRKGITINKIEMQKLINENIEKIVMEIKERAIYSDGTEGIVIEVRY